MTEDIRATVAWQKARRAAFVEPIPAGWVIVDKNSGQGWACANERYATEDEARAAIPAVLARVAAETERREQRAQAAAERTTAAYAASRPADAAGRTYRWVSTDLGTGRIYDDQPGATEYEHGVQLWENS